MLAKTFTALLQGLQTIKVEVEVDGNRGVPALILIGLPNRIVDEAKERITSALLNCGIRIRSKRTIVNLAPADINKNSPSVELAIAIGLLKMYGEITINTDDTLFFGELSLTGELKPVRGALPLVLAATALGFKRVVLPAANAAEVKSVGGLIIHPLTHLREYIHHAYNHQPLPTLTPQRISRSRRPSPQVDVSHIIGQLPAKRALAIAAAGKHHLLLTGPPGVGKTLLAQALPGILPPLTEGEALEVTSLYSIAQLLPTFSLITEPPFRSPHHHISRIGLVGGGSQLKPGEISLAHRGVLFLDEMSEYQRTTLESLRQPLEEGTISVARSTGSLTFPAQFTLVAATNPCPCGYAGSVSKKCTCSEALKLRYQHRLSGPLLDRIDCFCWVSDVKTAELQLATSSRLTSKDLQDQIKKARDAQLERYHHATFTTNSQAPSTLALDIFKVTNSAQSMLANAADTLSLSTRSYFKTLKVARTIADLEQSSKVEVEHMAEALQYRKN